MNSEGKVSFKPFALTREEEESYQHLKQHSPEWAELFLHHLLDGRDKITARLMGSLYRENLVGGYENSQILSPYHLENAPFKDNDVLFIHFPTQNITICAEVTGRHAFNRIDVQGPFYWCHDHTYHRVFHPNELLDIILKVDTSLVGEHSQQFEDDLENSATHMALALSYHAFKFKDDKDSLLSFIQKQPDAYLASEQSVIEGHPIHPGAKLRKGMTPKETIAYTSEYGNAISLQFVLIHESLIKTQSIVSTYKEAVFQMFNGLKDAIDEQVASSINTNEYEVMIIHPWQYQQVLMKDYAHELTSNHIIPIAYEVPYYAGLSFRTLMPKKPNISPHIKLSTNVHITGEIRTLSEQTTHNGPLMTQILRHIESEDRWFSELNTKTVPEWAGIHFYNPLDDASIQEQRSEQLGTLYRENIYRYVKEDELPLIPSSLVGTLPHDATPLIMSLIKRYQHHYHLDAFDSILKWFDVYAASLIDYVVPLLVKYGIALEAHLQNTIAIVNKETGALTQMLIRDFEGLRIDQKQLNASGYSTHHFHEKSRILTDSQSTVFNKAFYSTVQNHLGELVGCIAKFAQGSTIEQDLWHIVRTRIQYAIEEMKSIESNDTRISAIEAVFFSPKIDYKCVTTMRLLDEAHAYTYIQVDNPLKIDSLYK
ncbi:sialic acid synthase [Staphylococcus hyicus]|uniref:IucA/IucC family protein n=1 Tax=Staphylococcus hyicus TaxID=1284 RepID=UPI00217ED848|nr:IucA/IucC family protein [Staphylococcus hyicus]UWF57446.1 sialic acid synthase [Staphylococcus hyicus]